MKQHDGGTTRRTVLISGGLGAITAMVGLADRAQAAMPAYGEQERAAIKVCSDFIGTFRSRDADQLAMFVADDIQFRGTPAAPLTSGREAFVDDLKKFLMGPIGRSLTYSGKPTEAFAVGGAAGTTVLTKRVNSRTVDGKTVPVALAAMFWVVDGKIQAWYDFPLAAPRRAPA